MGSPTRASNDAVIFFTMNTLLRLFRDGRLNPLMIGVVVRDIRGRRSAGLRKRTQVSRACLCGDFSRIDQGERATLRRSSFNQILLCNHGICGHVYPLHPLDLFPSFTLDWKTQGNKSYLQENGSTPYLYHSSTYLCPRGLFFCPCLPWETLYKDSMASFDDDQLLLEPVTRLPTASSSTCGSTPHKVLTGLDSAPSTNCITDSKPRRQSHPCMPTPSSLRLEMCSSHSRSSHHELPPHHACFGTHFRSFNGGIHSGTSFSLFATTTGTTSTLITASAYLFSWISCAVQSTTSPPGKGRGEKREAKVFVIIIIYLICIIYTF